MKHLSVMLKPASSLCNMHCAYCFYKDVSRQRETVSHGIMSHTTALRVLENMLAGLSPGDQLDIAFQGGEPTLAGLDFFRFFVDHAKKLADGVGLHWALQTNGLALDAEWCAFLRQNHFLVGLSFDFFAHDENRPDTEGNATAKRVLAAMEQLRQHRVEFNVLCTLTNGLARSPQKVWNQLRKLNLRFVQFTPCLAGLQGGGHGCALSPRRFASFYNGIIPLWYAAYAKDEYISIKLIDDLVHLLGAGEVNACGLTGRCMPQMVVEADGSVYPCDFYVLDAFRLGSLAEQNILELYRGGGMQAFATAGREEDALCCACPYHRLCGGGCKRMKSTMHDNIFCGYRDVLEQNMPLLMSLCKQNG